MSVTVRRLSSYEVKQLRGESFFVHDINTGGKVRFSIPKDFGQWPRTGVEGIVFPVICHHPTKGDIPSILKSFFSDVPGRPERFKKLLGFGLASNHAWLYTGVPYTWIDQEIAGLPIKGHICKHAGIDFEIQDDLLVLKNDSKGRSHFDRFSEVSANTARVNYVQQF